MKEPFVRFFRDNFVPPRPSVEAEGQKPRIAFIDLAKGVCILLVVMMHADLGHGLPALRALRMPLYFMLSGLFFKDYGNFRTFTAKKVNKILIPFLFFALSGFVVQQCAALAASRAPDAFGLWQPFVRPSMMRSNQPVWFLVCLFWVNLLYCAVSVNMRRRRLRTAAVFAMGAAGCALAWGKVYLPLFFASSLTAMPFFFFGLQLRRCRWIYPGCGDRVGPLAGATMCAVAVAGCACFGTPYIEFRENFYGGNPVVCYAVSAWLVVGLLLVCKGVGWLPVVSYMGRYSIVVLGLHFVYLTQLPPLLAAWTGRAPGPFGRFGLAVLLCWLSIPVCRAFLPHVTAQRDFFFPTKKN